MLIRKILFKHRLLSFNFDTSLKYFIIICLLYIVYSSCRKLIIYNVSLWINPFNDLSIRMLPHSILINETNKNLTYFYYRHATSTRNSSYPFISGDTFRAFADFIYDETRKDNLTYVKYGNIVFVKSDFFEEFFREPYRSIKNPFILVTHNSDDSAPGYFQNKLQDKKILAWYGSNPNIQNHSKFFPLPIGFNNRRWSYGNLDKLIHGFENYRKPWSKRTTLLYANFQLRTNPIQRRLAMSQAQLINHTQTIYKPISFENYLEEIGNTKFVLSPSGNGLDCHRTWEALMMGAAPVILSSELDPLFNKLPAVIINNWTNLTESLLLSYDFASYDNLMPIVLYARYWREKLLQHRSVSVIRYTSIY